MIVFQHTCIFLIINLKIVTRLRVLLRKIAMICIVTLGLDCNIINLYKNHHLVIVSIKIKYIFKMLEILLIIKKLQES